LLAGITLDSSDNRLLQHLSGLCALEHELLVCCHEDVQAADQYQNTNAAPLVELVGRLAHRKPTELDNPTANSKTGDLPWPEVHGLPCKKRKITLLSSKRVLLNEAGEDTWQPCEGCSLPTSTHSVACKWFQR